MMKRRTRTQEAAARRAAVAATDRKPTPDPSVSGEQRERFERVWNEYHYGKQ